MLARYVRIVAWITGRAIACCATCGKARERASGPRRLRLCRYYLARLWPQRIVRMPLFGGRRSALAVMPSTACLWPALCQVLSPVVLLRMWWLPPLLLWMAV